MSDLPDLFRKLISKASSEMISVDTMLFIFVIALRKSSTDKNKVCYKNRTVKCRLFYSL